MGVNCHSVTALNSFSFNFDKNSNSMIHTGRKKIGWVQGRCYALHTRGNFKQLWCLLCLQSIPAPQNNKCVLGCSVMKTLQSEFHFWKQPLFALKEHTPSSNGSSLQFVLCRRRKRTEISDLLLSRKRSCAACMCHFNTVYAGHEAHENGLLGHQTQSLRITSTHFLLPYS